MTYDELRIERMMELESEVKALTKRCRVLTGTVMCVYCEIKDCEYRPEPKPTKKVRRRDRLE